MEIAARFGTDGASPRAVHDVVKDLPIYADRPFCLTDGTDGFLDALPFMTKADLRRYFPHGFLRPGTSFASLIASKKVEVVRTSGTSSDRLQVLWDADWWERQEAAALKSHAYIGPRMTGEYTEAVLTTPLCSESVCKTGPATMEERRVDNLLFLNTQHDPSRWTHSDLARMADEIDRFRPAAIEADPVYLAVLARHLRDSRRPVFKFDWIILTYEFVSAIDKTAIRGLFGCPVFEFYGLTEAGVFFLECPKGRHHFCGSDSVVEVFRVTEGDDGWRGLPVNTGEAVVTTWGNSAAPLLRYRTGDLVTVGVDRCACGAPGPTVLSFEGRIRDVIKLPDGKVFTPRLIDDTLFGIPGLAQYVCVQEGPDSMRVDYVSDGPRDPGGEIVSQLHSILGTARVAARSAPFITPEQSGKYRTAVPL
ncbi:phenylacetate--CoA ligase family protein [bacterium]|nr:phenylacetate--CoA ligase family protein [bacterium]